MRTADTDIGVQAARLSRRYVVFRLAEQAYGIPVESVQEIVSLPLLSRPPGLPSMLEGFFSLEGIAVPVLRLGYLFTSTSQPPRLYTPLLIMRNAALPWAVMIDKAEGIVSIAQQMILPVPENSSLNESTEGIATVDEKHLILLCPDRILLKSEQRCLANLAALEQQRLNELASVEP